MTQIDRSRVVQVLRGRGDDAAAQRAEDELPSTFDPDDHAEVLLSYGVDAQDLDDQEAVEDTLGGSGGTGGTGGTGGSEEQQPTGLGSGAASGLGHSLTSEPEPLLGDDPTR